MFIVSIVFPALYMTPAVSTSFLSLKMRGGLFIRFTDAQSNYHAALDIKDESLLGMK